MKRGKGFWFGVFFAFGIILLVLAITLFYLYNFHVFKTVRICLGEPFETQIYCETTQDCYEWIRVNRSELDTSLMPPFLDENLQRVLNEAVYCDETCKVRKLYGINEETFDIEELESCDGDQREFLIEIRGKEALEIYEYLKNRT